MGRNSGGNRGGSSSSKMPTVASVLKSLQMPQDGKSARAKIRDDVFVEITKGNSQFHARIVYKYNGEEYRHDTGSMSAGFYSTGDYDKYGKWISNDHVPTGKELEKLTKDTWEEYKKTGLKRYIEEYRRWAAQSFYSHMHIMSNYYSSGQNRGQD